MNAALEKLCILPFNGFTIMEKVLVNIAKFTQNTHFYSAKNLSSLACFTFIMTETWKPIKFIL